MQFAQPIWIFIGILVCVSVFFVLRQLTKKRQIALQNFAAKALIEKLTENVSERKRGVKVMLLLAGIFTCFLALARPQYGHHWIDVKRKGIDILFAVDTSLSMGVEDIQPNRLERSKFAILDFLGQLDGDRVGLMPFAGSAFLMCPLTVDYNAFEQSLQAVDTNIIPEPGTNLGEAIRGAETVLHNDANHKLLIIVTDGENLEGDAVAAATKAAENGMTIFTVGVGTPQGELIPNFSDGRQSFVKDPSGKFVISKLDEITLRAIAETTGGLYAPLGNKGQGLATIYQQKLVLIPKEELAEKRHKVPIDRFPWFLGIALILLIAEYLLNSRKNVAGNFRLPHILRRKMMMPILLAPLCGLLGSQSDVLASTAETAYADKDYQKAGEYYQQALEKAPDNATLHFNSGTVSYKNKEYDNAISSFNQALQSDDLALQKKAYYNLGNAHYRKGETLQQNNIDKTKEQWQEALTAYTSSLELDPENEDARFNHDFIMKKLKELQKQEDQQQQQQQQQDKNEKSQQDNKDESQSQSQNQEQQADGKQESSKEPAPTPQSAQQDKKEQDAHSTSSEMEQEPSAEKQPQQQASMSPQKMSVEEAKQLLQEMQNEEGTLNFLPKTAKDEDKSGVRNW